VANTWTIRFARRATEDKYKIPRGEAARFTEAIAILRNGPALSDREMVENSPHTYQYIRNGYLIAYEVLEAEHAIRVVYFEILL